MKTKLITSIILASAIATSAFAADNYYTLTSSNNVFSGAIPSDILSNYNGFDGEVFTFQETSMTGNSGATTIYINLAKFTSDFTFNSGFTFYTANTYVDNFTINPRLYINKGATVTINKSLTYNVRTKHRLWVDNDSGDYGTLVINAAPVRIAENDGVKNTSLGNCELFIGRGHVELNVASEFGYTSLYGGSSLTIRANSSSTTFAIRAARSNKLYTKTLPTAIQDAITAAGKKGIRDNGTLILDGASYSSESCTLNTKGDESDCADYAHVFTLKYGQADVAEGLKLSTMSTYFNDAANGSKGMDAFIVEDMNYLDTISTKTDLKFGSYASRIYINGVNFTELINLGKIQVSSDTTGYNVYTYIPEPSTYAMIFGAIALGFVAYRRRK